VLVLASALAVLAAPARLASSADSRPFVATRTARTTAAAANPRTIHHFRKETWRWQVLMRRPKTSAQPTAPTKQTLVVWKQRAAVAYTQALRPPHRAVWVCIHRFEAAWDDPGAPYYGGLQMDWGFMARYGPDLLRRKGTADHWTPVEQMWVAERALRAGRGFYPWPNAARICGVL
jgi:hypothetical protein